MSTTVLPTITPRRASSHVTATSYMPSVLPVDTDTYTTVN